MTDDKYHTDLMLPLTARAATRFPVESAIVTPRSAMTFDELHRRVRRVGAVLSRKGVRPGDFVAVRAGNSTEAILVLIALMQSGAVAVPLPVRYPARSLACMCAAVGARLVIEDEDGGDGQSVAEADAGGAIASHLLGELTTAAEDVSDDAPPESLDPDRTVLVIFTSGSTGDPRPAALSYSNLFFSALGSNRNLTLGAGDRWLLCLPLYHVGGVGILIRCFLAGAAVAVPDEMRLTASTVDELAASHVSVVAAQLRRLVDGPAVRSDLKAVLVGGGATPPELVRKAIQHGLPIRKTYGLTEMASQVATSTGSSPVDDAVGSILPFRSVRISTENEILVRGETLFQGYVEGGQVRLPTDDDGWLHTGDAGYLDSDCSLVVFGRIDDMIVSGGENIFPAEIERIVDNIDGIERSLVIGVEDDVFGERPIVFVSYSNDPISKAEILAQLELVLPRYKLPVAVFELPDSAGRTLGKISRPHLQGIAYKLLQEGSLSPPKSNR